MVPFEEREGMQGENTPETVLTGHHEVFEEGDTFESSFLRLDRCCFLTLLRHTFVGKLVITMSRREELPSRVHRLSQSLGVTEVLC